MWVIIMILIVLILILSKSSDGFTLQEIPKIIWTYWDSPELPEFIDKTITKWRELNPGWTIHVLHPENVAEFIPEVDIFSFKFADTKPRQSDFVRLHVLAKYGGVWSDASIVPRSSFQWVLDARNKSGVEFISYYRKSATKNQDWPVIESWFFACIPGCRFVEQWRDELGVMNTLDKEADYQQNVKDRGVDIQDIPQPDYLNVYLSAQVVLQKYMTPDEIRSKIYVIDSEEGPFKHSVVNNWDPPKAMQWLCDTPSSELPDLIKIYGNERRAIDDDENLKCSYKIFE
jgi:hypothetical protein